jgi:hypothetical protein
MSAVRAVPLFREQDLRFWGRQFQKVLLDEGYADRSAIDRIFEGIAHLNGHNILCREMHEDAYRVHRRIVQMVAIYRYALIANYCVPPKPDGTLFTRRELARYLDCSLETYKKRVQRGSKLLNCPH